MSVKAIIFDCDGVMFESRNANLAFYNKVLVEYGYPPVSLDQKERAHLCHTASTPVVLEGLMGKDILPQARKYAASLDYSQFIPDMLPEPHLATVLDSLSRRFPVGIATNRGSSIGQILDHFSLRTFFTAVVTSHDVERPKPAPDMLFLAAEKLQQKPEDCLFIGDSELDRMAATEAGMNFIGYGEKSGGKITIKNHLQLLDYFHVEKAI